MPVSAVDCVQPAIQHTREQLFSRFRIGQWSRLALVGILAAEMHASGCNFEISGTWARCFRHRGAVMNFWRRPFPTSIRHGSCNMQA